MIVVDETYSLETLGKRGLECLTTLCPCPLLGLGADSCAGAGVDSDFVSFLGSSFFSALPLPLPLALALLELALVLDSALASLPSGDKFEGTEMDDRSSPSSARMAMI